MKKRKKKLNIYRCDQCWQIYEQDPECRMYYECPKCKRLLQRIGSREIEVD
jgi:transcription initiation factor IIE alpha subunit